MEIFKEGDKSKAVCEHCKKISETTFKVRSATIQDGNKLLKVPNILVGVCNTCDKVASIPQQSYAAVAEHKKKTESKSQDFRVPRHFLDILNNSISVIGLNASKDLRVRIVRYYLASLATSREDIRLLKKHLESDLLSGNFKRGDVVSIQYQRKAIACGRIEYGARELNLLKGLASDLWDEAVTKKVIVTSEVAVHRDNLFIKATA